MRTTLTIDDDVAVLLKQEVRKSGRPLKQVVNDRLRLGFTAAKPPARKPFTVKPINLGLPRDFDKVEDILDYLEGPGHL